MGDGQGLRGALRPSLIRSAPQTLHQFEEHHITRTFSREPPVRPRGSASPWTPPEISEAPKSPSADVARRLRRLSPYPTATLPYGPLPK